MNVKKRLEYFIKHNSTAQFLYKRIFSFVLFIAGKLVKNNDKIILFNSFGGRKYNDSPKVLFERMRSDSRFKEYNFVWAFEEPMEFRIDGASSIRIDSWDYFITALKAKVWISSVNIERGLHFKKRSTIYVNTWHGAGTKKIGNACPGRNDYDFSNVDIMLVQSNFEKEIFVRDFKCNPKAIRTVGFPRNDELFAMDDKDKQELRKQLNIPSGIKVILYAPTWRDSRDGGVSYEFRPPINIEKWKQRFGKEYIMLFRMHVFTTEFDIDYGEFARDVSKYENLNHILVIADVVVTDYSTIVFDCAIAQKPFVCFGYDYQTYKEERGFYFDLQTVYPGGVLKTEEEAMDRIEVAVSGAGASQYHAFRQKYIEAGGRATEECIDEISKLLKTQRGRMWC